MSVKPHLQGHPLPRCLPKESRCLGRIPGAGAAITSSQPLNHLVAPAVQSLILFYAPPHLSREGKSWAHDIEKLANLFWKKGSCQHQKAWEKCGINSAFYLGWGGGWAAVEEPRPHCHGARGGSHSGLRNSALQKYDPRTPAVTAGAMLRILCSQCPLPQPQCWH